MSGKAMKPKDGYSWNPVMRYPRNKECYCGSGSKFKKCCEKKISACVKSSELAELEEWTKRIENE